MKNLKIELKNVNDLTPHPQNTRVHGDKQIQELAKSIEMFGIIRPAVVDENNVILTGHGLVDAIKYLGRDEVDVHVIKGLSETDKKKLMLADNRIFTLGFDDYDAIDDILKEIGDFDIPGFDADDLQMLYGDTKIIDTLEDYKIEEKEQEARQDKSAEPITPSQSIIEQREEMKNITEEEHFVFCQNCGSKVEL